MSVTNRGNSRRRWPLVVGSVIGIMVTLGVLWWLLQPPPPLPPPETTTATPTESPTATNKATATPPLPIVVQTLASAALRTGPGGAYAVLVQLMAPAEFTAVGRDESGEWLLVCCIAEQQAWVAVTDVRELPDMQLLPIVTAPPLPPTDTPTPTETPLPTDTPLPTELPLPTDTPLPTEPSWGATETFGWSIEQRPLIAYRFGIGPINLALVGGIHGGYEINTIELMNLAIQYYINTPSEVPQQITLWIIPTLNPDGEARFYNDVAAQADPLLARPNANNVDLNRNFDCAWQEYSMHQDRQVWAGSGPFSEPETVALRSFVVANSIDSLIFYHSQGRWVEDGVCAEASPLVQQYGQIVAAALGFPFYTSGSSYDVTGDAPGYFNSMGVATLAIELTNHDDPEWDTQRLGIAAALAWATTNLQ